MGHQEVVTEVEEAQGAPEAVVFGLHTGEVEVGVVMKAQAASGEDTKVDQGEVDMEDQWMITVPVEVGEE